MTSGQDGTKPPGISPADVRRALDPERRQRWGRGPRHGAPSNSWECFDDDTVLAWIDALPGDHGRDEQLVEIVASDRHFYVRQRAAGRINDPERLEVFATDRGIGQILARRLSRADDAVYLAALIAESRHAGVREAAQAELAELERRLAERQAPGA